MADKKVEETKDFGDKLERPASGASGGSSGSKKGLPGAVTELTTKALQEFRLSDDGAVSDSGEGETTNFAVENTDDNELTEGQTFVEYTAGEYDEVGDEDDMETANFTGNINVENEEDFEESGDDEDDDSDGDNDLVVLDPDHVSKREEKSNKIMNVLCIFLHLIALYITKFCLFFSH